MDGTVLVVVIVLVLCAVVGALVAWPVITPGVDAGEDAPGATAAAAERRAVEDELRQSLTSIREIAFDRDSGHLSDEDFQALDADERARAIELLRRRDRLDADGEGVPGAEPAA